MNELSTRTLPIIAEEIRYLDRQAKRLVLGHAIEIGNRLIEAKAMLPHGEWGDWIRKELSYSQSSAQNFMRIAEEYGATQLGLFGPEAKSQTLGNLPYTKALKLLAVPEEEREEFIETHDVEAMSTRELEAAIKERDELKRQLEEERNAGEGAALKISRLEESVSNLNDFATAAQREKDDLKAQIKELESRPVEVAVQEADPDEIAAAVDEAVRKAQQEADINLEKALDAAKVAAAKESAELVEKLNEARKAAEDAQKALDASVGADDPVRPSPDEIVALEQKAAQAESEAEALRKQLALSDAGTARFKVWFSQAQTCFQQMQAIIVECADADTAAKLSSALRKLVETWGASI